MSVESGLRTFRDADGLWEEYPVAQVATHEGWEADPVLVTNFYNMLRKKPWYTLSIYKGINYYCFLFNRTKSCLF